MYGLVGVRVINRCWTMEVKLTDKDFLAQRRMVGEIEM